MNEQTGRIKICDGFYISLYHRMPNKFHRIMMRLMFGWEFECGAEMRGKQK